MPRPAIPKPGFSVLRLHNSKHPHLITHLSSIEKINLMNSVAQDIEGCIWVVGHYIQSGHLDATHTFEFDHIINEIHRGERDELEERLQKMSAKAKIYKRRAKEMRREAKRGRDRRRQKKDVKRRDEQKRREIGSQQIPVEPLGADVDCLVPDCLHAGPPDRNDCNSGVSSESDSTGTGCAPTQATVVTIDLSKAPSPAHTPMEVDTPSGLL
jgi:hypothetical protein